MISDQPPKGKILIIDDNPSVHEDIRKVLTTSEDLAEKKLELDRIGSAFFGESEPQQNCVVRPAYELDSAFQGQEGLERVSDSLRKGAPYDLAFVDMRMPPGWDGVETISHLWQEDPDLQIVVCTAFSDYTWSEIIEKLGSSDKLLILKKPFDNIEVSQLASAMIEKRRLLTRMENAVEQRTEQLQVAVQRAKQAAVTKSQFLVNMSHDIRTPLTSIIGYADTFFTGSAGENLTPEQHNATEIIVHSGEHLAALINEILDLSKIEQGKLVCRKKTCEPSEITKNVAETVHLHAQKKGIELRVHIADGTPKYIESDPSRLKQILINLIRNAVKFTHHGYVQIEVSGISVDGEPFTRFQVIDTGIGINEEEIEHIFKPFTQADGSMTRDYGGTGIGLTVSKRLSQLLGGDLHCESQVGCGSNFTCEIPVGNPTKPQVTPDVEKANDVPLDNLKILLAEDDQVNRHFASVMLGRAGAQVVGVGNGKEALDEVLNANVTSPFDVVLMDMQMPVMDGYTATGKLRELDCKIPIIALTAHAMEGDREKCIEAGCDEYTTKPINRNVLVKLITSFVESPPLETLPAQ